jgi:transcriptional regulator with XRE-family HTH domain
MLRAKRRNLTPTECGITTRRRRLSPGLSRAEAAQLADIGSSWYARMEAGRVPHPTIATLCAIARALKLSESELRVVLELAEIVQPDVQDGASEKPTDLHLPAKTGKTKRPLDHC